MISLEAAAEPHYVGESSGSFWSMVVAKGMHLPRVGADHSKARPGRARSPPPTQLTDLREALQAPIPDAVADHMLVTVYQHIHARVSIELLPSPRLYSLLLTGVVSIHELDRIRLPLASS